MPCKDCKKLMDWARRQKNPLLVTVTNPAPKPKRRRKKPAPKAKRKKPAAKAKLVNPSPSVKKNGMAAARRAFKRFHGVEPKNVLKIGDGDLVLLALGSLEEIVYKPDRGDRKGPAWFHKFGKGAILATDPEGKRLYIVDKKGKIRVDFDRGILG